MLRERNLAVERVARHDVLRHGDHVPASVGGGDFHLPPWHDVRRALHLQQLVARCSHGHLRLHDGLVVHYLVTHDGARGYPPRCSRAAQHAANDSCTHGRARKVAK